jgi:hypothetical protein
VRPLASMDPLSARSSRRREASAWGSAGRGAECERNKGETETKERDTDVNKERGSTWAPHGCHVTKTVCQNRAGGGGGWV